MKRFKIPMAIPTPSDYYAARDKVKNAIEMRGAKKAVRQAQREQLHDLAAQLVREQKRRD